jgi:hypothetical protein
MKPSLELTILGLFLFALAGALSFDQPTVYRYSFKMDGLNMPDFDKITGAQQYARVAIRREYLLLERFWKDAPAL